MTGVGVHDVVGTLFVDEDERAGVGVGVLDVEGEDEVLGGGGVYVGVKEIVTGMNEGDGVDGVWERLLASLPASINTDC